MDEYTHGTESGHRHRDAASFICGVPPGHVSAPTRLIRCACSCSGFSVLEMRDRLNVVEKLCQIAAMGVRNEVDAEIFKDFDVLTQIQQKVNYIVNLITTIPHLRLVYV